jgi:hypothetical protein
MNGAQAGNLLWRGRRAAAGLETLLIVRRSWVGRRRGGGGAYGSFGQRRGGAIEQVEDGGGHGLAGVGEEEADLPHFGFAELGFEGRHAGEADAIFDFPIGFANRVVADADDGGIVAVCFEQLGRVREHVVAEGGGPAVEAVAEGAAFNVNARAGGEVGLIGLHMGADHIFLNAGVEGDGDELALVGKRGIGGGDGYPAIGEIDEHGQGDENDAEYES